MPRVIVVVVCLFFFLSFSSVAAHEQVVVVPLNSSKKLANIITVAKSGGDFTNPVAAVASITDASASNSYLVVIGPGSYTLTEPLIMKRDVSIAGSGRNATTLTGYISSATADSSSAIVVGAQFTQLSDMTISNRGGDTFSIGFYSNDNGPTLIENVAISVSGGTYNRGLFIRDESACGVILSNSHVLAKGTGSGISTYGAYIQSCCFEIKNSSLVALSGAYTRGIYQVGATTVFKNVEAKASDGSTNNYGIYSQTDSYTRIYHSDLKGTSAGINVSSGTALVMNSTIEGGVNHSGGTLTCMNSNNGSSAELGSNCIP